ncbi:aminodeoxychorismate synthase component I [Nocardia donostiensis]|uniref:aminodeoxychorismate synthase n=1 Tax=Nocardia donostiensis TaxID=1538463 RepID=A0A1V2TGP6_9NOCA|nr:aminodeoxychorismate synthase component I [Nocardia donostiensis]ONM48628.1 aminodeoxychorismate synthase, component I [Nocardia donostiensis]OQS23282.1 aminodeoxychorismate synthase, component I [Nocardia donostiensis]
MRTLLIDNYDSFTYNLYQLISQVNGVEPTVVRNDEVDSVAQLRLDRFDNIVISPGPGRPDVARDIGISAAVIREAGLPLLGVCLGHQGIVLAAGGAVAAAPTARHGYLDRIEHDGRSLFTGIPQSFTAVRYHSLSARTVPHSLEVTAVSGDGVVMGVRHRTRPQWGVQFHPESIASEYGAALLANFAALTRQWARAGGGQGHANTSTVASRPGRDSPPPAPAIEIPLHDSDSADEPGPASRTRASVGQQPPITEALWVEQFAARSAPAREATAPPFGHEYAGGQPSGTELPPASRAPQTARSIPPVPRAVPGERGAPDCGDMPDTGSRWQLQHHVIARAIDTEAIFVRLYSESPTAFWLDSEHVEPGLDRFSFLGDASGPSSEVVRYRVGTGAVTVTSSDGCERAVPGGILDYLADQLRDRRTGLPDLPFDFAGGYIGYLGYEVKADCGGAAVHHAPMPDAQWIFADRSVVVDHEAGRTYLLVLTEPTPDAVQAGTQWLRDTATVLETLPTWSNPRPLTIGTDPGQVAAALGRGREQYLADIDVCLQKLREGESYEICVTDQATVSATVDGLDCYRMLRRCNPAPYAAYLRFDELEIACSSPERFLKVDRNRRVESKPIKGTAARGADPEEDEQLRTTLAGDPKTIAENLMIVDLLRNDLGRVCEIGSVHVPKLMAVETYSTLHQLVSTVRGTLRAGVDVIDCLRACFPGGSMTGAPKLRTMEIIDELETEARGVYSGTIGFLGLDGTADLNIVIRTAVRYGDRWQIGAGGAIVLDSDPDSEYAEVLLKAGAAMRAIVPGAGSPTPAVSEPVVWI